MAVYTAHKGGRVIRRGVSPTRLSSVKVHWQFIQHNKGGRVRTCLNQTVGEQIGSNVYKLWKGHNNARLAQTSAYLQAWEGNTGSVYTAQKGREGYV